MFVFFVLYAVSAITWFVVFWTEPSNTRPGHLISDTALSALLALAWPAYLGLYGFAVLHARRRGLTLSEWVAKKERGEL